MFPYNGVACVDWIINGALERKEYHYAPAARYMFRWLQNDPNIVDVYLHSVGNESERRRRNSSGQWILTEIGEP
jgi:hypothetical protein